MTTKQAFFEAGDRVITNHGHAATVREAKPITLGDSLIWNMSTYLIEFDRGGKMLVDFVDAHHTSGGTLRPVATSAS